MDGKRNRIFSLFIVLECVVFSNNSFAQDIVISLGLQEELKGKTNIGASGPFLRIDYINNGHSDYYFPSVLSPKWETPHFAKAVSTPDIINNEQVREMLFDERVFEGEQYLLLLDFIQEKRPFCWVLLPLNITEEYTVPLINLYLYAYGRFLNGSYHEAFYSKHELRCRKKLRESPSLIFLRAGERVTQLIDIKVLKDAGIILTVRLSSETPPNAMRLNLYPGDEYNLPSTVLGYSLYKGIIKSNSVKLDFSGRWTN